MTIDELIINLDFEIQEESIEELEKIKVLLKICSDIIKHGREDIIKKDVLNRIEHYLI
jgi:hypothetical protein